jgi:hypothetical protein
MDFLNTTKLFSCISGFYNMFVKLQRVLANIPKKYKNLILGEFIYYSPLMFGERNPKGMNIQNIIGNNFLLFTVNVWIKKS